MENGQGVARSNANEPFELVEHLGTGGFAHTYRARVLDEDLREDFGSDLVALKIPLDRKKERALTREVELIASLHLHLKEQKSCNLVRYLGFAHFRGQIVMVMEYVEGSLRDRIGEIGRQKPLPTGEAVSIARGVAEGLSFIHKEHVFHRDIKPENILLEGNTPKVSDLGIARMLESNELASTTTGTIYYMAPEILSEEGASFSADIWSLGVTLYEIATGKLPFGDRSTPIGTMVDLIRRAPLLPPVEVCGDIPAGLSSIICRALEKDPSHRYASADEMAKALERYEQATDPVEQELIAIRESTDGLRRPRVTEARFREFVEAHPDESRAYRYLGEFYNQCQNYKKAIEVFQQGLTVDPYDAMLHWDLALVYQQRSDRRKHAVDSLRTALRLGLEPRYEQHAKTLLKALKRAGS